MINIKKSFLNYITLVVLNSSAWNPLFVCKQMNFGLFKILPLTIDLHITHTHTHTHTHKTHAHTHIYTNINSGHWGNGNEGVHYVYYTYIYIYIYKEDSSLNNEKGLMKPSQTSKPTNRIVLVCC